MPCSADPTKNAPAERQLGEGQTIHPNPHEGEEPVNSIISPAADDREPRATYADEEHGRYVFDTSGGACDYCAPGETCHLCDGFTETVEHFESFSDVADDRVPDLAGYISMSLVFDRAHRSVFGNSIEKHVDGDRVLTPVAELVVFPHHEIVAVRPLAARFEARLALIAEAVMAGKFPTDEWVRYRAEDGRNAFAQIAYDEQPALLCERPGCVDRGEWVDPDGHLCTAAPTDAMEEWNITVNTFAAPGEPGTWEVLGEWRDSFSPAAAFDFAAVIQEAARLASRLNTPTATMGDADRPAVRRPVDRCAELAHTLLDEAVREVTPLADGTGSAIVEHEPGDQHAMTLQINSPDGGTAQAWLTADEALRLADHLHVLAERSQTSGKGVAPWWTRG